MLASSGIDFGIFINPDYICILLGPIFSNIMKTPLYSQQFSILVVDDNKENLKVVSNFLKEIGYQIALSLGARDALKILQENDIDLILLDIMMPEVDGYTLCSQIKADHRLKDIPVIFLTAKTDTSDLVEGFRVGGVDYITKPFQKEELIVRVRNHIELAYSRRQIIEQSEQILKINKTKDRLYSVIAHDIKSPFANITMLLTTVSDGYLEPGTDEYNEILQSLSTSTKETYALLENLLQWTRSQTGDLECAPEVLPLNEIVGRAIRFLKPTAIKKLIQLEDILEDELMIKADRNMMHSVLQNLIANAIKFTEEGGSVHVKANKKKDQVIIKVIDTGVGMSDDMQNKLFIEGQHFSTHGTNSEKGSGLGLLIVKDFIRRNHGTLNIESQPGKGTTFTVALPAGK
jgi:two-component system, sensor histidine kinase and response regulator